MSTTDATVKAPAPEKIDSDTVEWMLAALRPAAHYLEQFVDAEWERKGFPRLVVDDGETLTWEGTAVLGDMISAMREPLETLRDRRHRLKSPPQSLIDDTERAVQAASYAVWTAMVLLHTDRADDGVGISDEDRLIDVYDLVRPLYMELGAKYRKEDAPA